MFDIGFTELLVIGVVALIVVGPKDLPGMFRTLGRFTARARKMGREFSQAMNDAADETGANDIMSTLKTATSPKDMGLDAINKAADGFEKWDPAKALRDQKTADASLKEKETSKETPVQAKMRDAKTTSTKTTSTKTGADASLAAKPAKPKSKGPATKAAPKAASKSAAKPVAKPATKTAKTAPKSAKKPKPKTTDTSDA